MGIDIEFEVIAKYNGDVLNIEKELDVYIEVLGYNYAIISLKSYDEIDKLLEYKEIEYIEKPFILQTQDKQSFSSTGISKFKNKTDLTGKGTILGIIDSGIDYNLPIFKDKNGDTKILYYWDQTSSGNPPNGFKKGYLYSEDDINKAIRGEVNIPVASNSTHGTHVAGICSEIANEASLIVVKIGGYNTDYYSKSTEFMRAIKFIVDKSLELKMPVAINISYGSNEGSHKGLSLFEEYIDEMASCWKNNIVVASGNNRDKGGHVFINIKDKMDNIEVEFVVSENEKIININIWPDFIDEFSVYLVNPSNSKSQPISIIYKEIKNILGRTKVKGYFYSTGTYSLVRRVTFQLTSDISINPGIWKIVFIPINIVTGDIDIYLPTSEGINKDTRFLIPDKELTVTVPGTCKKVITVGSYNSRSDTVSIFSGEGDIGKNIYKPDILAPGENIVSYLPGGSIGALSGTSMATPHVTGVCALLLEWGVVRGNDKFLYSQKLKSVLIKNAKRYNEITYPNNSMGYGMLDLSSVNLESLLTEGDGKSLYRKHRKIKKIKRTNDLEVVYANLIPRIGVVHKIGFEEQLKNLNNGYHIYRISYNLVIIYQERDYIYDINEILNLNLVDRTMDIEKVALLGKINLGINEGVVAMEDIGASFFKDTPNISINGTGVLIGIPDSGIDYLHEDFIYPDRTSKIAYLWDQTKDGKPPSGYFIGSEYNNEEINNAIKNSDNTLSKDEEGHGTMMSSICAGLGNKEKEYAGIAEGAELIVVKMEKINGYYNSIHLYAAIEYIYMKSKELDKPLVINISCGSNFVLALNSLQVGVEDGRLNTYFKQGVCIVTGVGNEGNAQTHTSGKIDKIGEYVDIELEIYDLEDMLEIQILTNKPDKIIVTVITPTGEESKLLEVASYTTISGLFDLEGTMYTIKYIYPTANQGQQETRVILENVKSGIWKIRLYGEYITNGIYHLFLPNKEFLNPGTKLTKSNPYNTINSPANYNETIAVGAYDTTNSSLWPNSSRGYTLTNTKKPDIVAPGVNIIASYPGNNYATITGTSVSAAHVSGAIALYLQYTLVDGNYKNRSYVQQIKTYLKSGAKRKDDTIYPNKDNGYGILDVKGMFIQLR